MSQQNLHVEAERLEGDYAVAVCLACQMSLYNRRTSCGNYVVCCQKILSDHTPYTDFLAMMLAAEAQ